MAQTKRKTTASKTSQKSNKKAIDDLREKEVFEKKIKQNRINHEIWAIVTIALGVFFAIAIQTTAAGKVGELIHHFFCGLFGNVGGIIPYYIVTYGVLLLFNKTGNSNKKSIILFSLTFLMISLMYSERFIDISAISFKYITLDKWYIAGIAGQSGGAVGMMAALLVLVWFGKTGLYIFGIATIMVSLLLLSNISISQFWFNYKTKKVIKKQMQKEAMQEEAEFLKIKEKEIAQQIAAEPISFVDEANDRKKKKNILSYMLDDKLFLKKDLKKEEFQSESESESESEIKYGLEEATKLKEGYGIGDSAHIVKPSQTEQQPLDYNFTENSIYYDQICESKSESIKTENISTEQADFESPQIESINDEIESASSNDEGNYKFPPIELLIAPTLQKNNENKEDVLKEKADKLEKTLHDFKVDAKVTNVTQGPAVTRYEVQPSTGVKVSSIVKLSDDIALNMEARSIRIEAPIPGKPAVGIEIENESIKMIRLREILDSKEFKEAKSKISFAVGKDIEGNCLVADLKSMPHMLIAGSTGSGKSVCINSIIISLIYKSKPSEVKLLLIDPKVVELGIYNSIPHMMIPVVTEPSKAAAALNWAVCEMNERYKKFASNGVRDLESYNKTMREKELFAEVLPQIVIIIDELADLMMASPSQVEDSICRLAQMARAAGMHLIVATQRPSVDVVTGVIKANIPSRIAFAVSSQFDSRTILDMAGAEKLVGKGDMLFAPMGSNKPTRVQGNFITDEEVNAVVNFFKEQGTQTETTEASKSLLASMEENSAGNEITSDFEDELMSEAIEAVLKAEQASVSMLQRRFRIGYNRAARIIDEMEKLGIIGEADGSRPRIVNFTYEEYFSNLENSIAEEKEEKEETEE